MKNNSNKISELIQDYCHYIKKLNSETKSSSKKFFILIKKEIENKKMNNLDNIREELSMDYIKIKECLSRCGNTVYEIRTKEEVIEIVYSFLNTKKYLKNII